MKTVFSNAELAHVWANQGQESGRNNSGSFYFRGKSIFSYGEHYLAAQIHTVKGKTFALVNSHNYSQSTSGHLSDIRAALKGLMPFFVVSDPSNLSQAVKDLDAKGPFNVAVVLKGLKFNTGTQQYFVRAVKEHYKTASKLRTLIGRKPIVAKASELKAVRDHITFRLKRAKELNTPEALAAREAKNLKAAERQIARDFEKQQETIAKFRAGLTNQVKGLPYELLRVDGNTVVTSGGAVVPLRDAKLLLRALKNGMYVDGQRVGHYTVRGLKKVPTGGHELERAIQIGCHTILLSEAYATVGAASDQLSLVETA